MSKSELQGKHLSELHALAAAAGIEGYRMLPRAELIDRLAGAAPPTSSGGQRGNGRPSGGSASGRRSDSRQRQPRRGGGEPREGRPSGERRERRSRQERAEAGSGGDRAEQEPRPEPPEREGASSPNAAGPPAGSEVTPPKRRRRRRFGRRKNRSLELPDLLLPPEPGRQTVLCAPSRDACTELLRAVAADLAGAAKGPDPLALLIDPGPEELADWKREAPQAEIVAAAQAHHAGDALAAAAKRAGEGEDVILLIDSLTRLAEAYNDPAAAKEFLDAGRAQGGAGGGSLTVVAALERPA